MKLTGKDSVLSTAGEFLVPWWLTSSNSETNEEAELSRRGSLAPTITSTTPVLRGTVPAPGQGNQMANLKTIAERAVNAAKNYSPAVVAAARAQLAKVTDGKVTDLRAVPGYVGDNPARLKIATEAMLTSGVMLGDVLPRNLILGDADLLKIRQSAEALVNQLRAKYAAGSDQTLAEDASVAIAADLLRKRRVRTALQIFGSATNYFLTNPNGGIPATDFDWYDRVILER